jgi:hypothetical protein
MAHTEQHPTAASADGMCDYQYPYCDYQYPYCDYQYPYCDYQYPYDAYPYPYCDYPYPYWADGTGGKAILGVVVFPPRWFAWLYARSARAGAPRRVFVVRACAWHGPMLPPVKGACIPLGIRPYSPAPGGACLWGLVA